MVRARAPKHGNNYIMTKQLRKTQRWAKGLAGIENRLMKRLGFTKVRYWEQRPLNIGDLAGKPGYWPGTVVGRKDEYILLLFRQFTSPKQVKNTTRRIHFSKVFKFGYKWRYISSLQQKT